MAHFTYRLRAASGEALGEADFTLHELIPLVRHLARLLAARGDGREIAGLRAVVTPRYGGVPAEETYIKTGDGTPELPDAPRERLQISRRELDAEAPVSFAEELAAYYNPGGSRLCTGCPERRRCPGSGLPLERSVGDWIVLDPAAPRSNEPIAFFTLRLESPEGERLYQQDFRLLVLRFFLSLMTRLLERAGRIRLPAAGGVLGEIIARYEGPPRLDPILAPESRPRLVFLPPAAPVARRGEPGARRLVDWERLDRDALAEEPAELDIKVLASEPAPLGHRPAPAPDRVREVGTLDGSPLHVLLRRSVVEALAAACRASRFEMGPEAGGILVGEAYLRSGDDLLCVEVVGAIPATDGLGQPSRMTLDYHLLQPVQEQMGRDFPHHRTVGWYRFHPVAGGPEGADPLVPLAEEAFMHRNFFPEPWQVGLIFATPSGKARFYHRQGEGIAACSGYLLLDDEAATPR
jgi:hypothetical protein